MAKRKARPVIDWNGLTVKDINGIVTHFAEAETYYTQHIQTARAKGQTSTFESAIPVVQSRQRFWNEMIPHVERGEKISSHVREYLTYCRNKMEF